MTDVMERTGTMQGKSLEHSAYLTIQRLARDLEQTVVELLKEEASLSAPQYNVLRILRGAGQGGLACGEIAGRLITKDPDITRLLDRLERRGLVSRKRESDDRRIVTTRITPAGLELLAKLDEPVMEVHRRQLGHMSDEKLQTLLDLLAEAGAGK